MKSGKTRLVFWLLPMFITVRFLVSIYYISSYQIGIFCILMWSTSCYRTCDIRILQSFGLNKLRNHSLFGWFLQRKKKISSRNYRDFLWKEKARRSKLNFKLKEMYFCTVRFCWCIMFAYCWYLLLLLWL